MYFEIDFFKQLYELKSENDKSNQQNKRCSNLKATFS